MCSEIGHDRRSCSQTGKARSSRGRAFDSWLDLEWKDDKQAQKVVDENPDGMTLEQVGNVLGVTRERVRQIEVIALRKLRNGIGLTDTVELDGETFAVLRCDRCDELFIRRGRSKYCLECEGKYPSRRLEVAPRAPEPPKPVVPPPSPEPAPERHSGSSLAFIFDFSGWEAT